MLKYSPDGTVTGPAALLWARRDVTLPCVIEDGGRTWTWAELAAYAQAVADLLPGVAGARVTVTVPNGGAFVGALFGVWLAGAVPAPLSHRLPPVERDRVLETLDARAHVVWDDLDLDGVRIGPGTGDGTVATTPPPTLRIGDPGIVLCTSGTTGRPKAIVHPVRAVWGMVDGVTRHVVDPDDLPAPAAGPPRRVEPKPLVHIGSLFGLLFDLWRGRGCVVMPGFDPVRYAGLVREFDVELLSLVPSMIRMMLDAEVGPLNPPAKLVTTGTAALPLAWRDEFESRFGVPIQVTYGLTECCGAVAYEPVADVLGGTRRPGTSGQIVPQVRVEIRDDAGRPLPVGTEGHIWVSGETLRPSFVGDGGAAPVDGWFDTGDLGRIDQDRYVYLTGRDRELIVRGGLKIVPAEVEAALLEHDDVLDAAVAGRPDERLGEVPVAWVRTASGGLDADALLAFLRERLAAYKVPAAVHRVDAFPRTDTGKIRKHALQPGVEVPA